VNDEQLSRKLQSVGQACFVKFFGDFSSSGISREEVIEKLRSETNYTERSCISRTGHALAIIKAGLAKSALKIVVSSESKKVSEETRKQAHVWLNKLNT
jgi:hypothetical protein